MGMDDMNAKILAFVLIGILILGAFRLKVILTEHFLKARAVEIQEEEVTQDCGNLPQAITEDIKNCN
jgi:hypothetical protein